MKIKRLRDLREDNDYTQADIAKILNITRPQYNLYELGDRKIPIDKLEALANFYNVSIDYIMERTNYKKVVQSDEMSSRNTRLTEYYNRLSLEDQDYVMGKMIELYRSNERKKNSTKKGIG
jgi:transcriptional regulator with XRE-family HTH domain